jgi:MarR family transcriptional regulator, organic hydroperoxide resistance regulator
MSSSGGRAWQALLELLRLEKAHSVAVFAAYDLTPQLGFALYCMSTEGLTMRELATELTCDASNATGIVDRLEKRGLVERSPDPHDRRIKRVCLTAAGRRMREKVEQIILTPPASIAALSSSEQAELHTLLERAIANAEAERIRSSA